MAAEVAAGDGDPKTLEEALAALKRLKMNAKVDEVTIRKAEESNTRLMMTCVKLNQKIDLVMDSVEGQKQPSTVVPEVSEPEEAAALMCGYMNKKGRNVRNWKRRWFVLKGGVLSYYSDKGATTPKGSIPLETCVIDNLKEREQTGRPCMALVVEGRTLYCQADSKKENMAWFLAINCMQQQLDYTKKIRAQGKEPDARIISFFNQPMRTELVLDDSPLPIEAAVALESSVRFHTMMQILSLRNTSIDNLHFEPFSRALAGNKFLSIVHLQRNFLTADGGRLFAKALAKNDTMVEVYMDHNELGDEGLEAIAEALPSHPNLQILTLTHNKYTELMSTRAGTVLVWFLEDAIGSPGACAFARALSSTHILEKVALANNVVGDEGAAALASMIKENPTTRALLLENNQIGNEGSAAIIDALMDNASAHVLELNLTGNLYDDAVKEPLARLLIANKTLRRVDMAPVIATAESLAMVRLLHETGLLAKQ